MHFAPVVNRAGAWSTTKATQTKRANSNVVLSSQSTVLLGEVVATPSGLAHPVLVDRRRRSCLPVMVANTSPKHFCAVDDGQIAGRRQTPGKPGRTSLDGVGPRPPAISRTTAALRPFSAPWVLWFFRIDSKALRCQLPVLVEWGVTLKRRFRKVPSFVEHFPF